MSEEQTIISEEQEPSREEIQAFLNAQMEQTMAAMNQITDIVNQSLSGLDERLQEMERRIHYVEESRKKPSAGK